jgi:hypothetical protein
MSDVQVWGGGPFDNTRSCITLGALIVKIADDLEAEIKHLEKAKVAEQEALALVRCLVTLMKFDSHKGLGPPRWKAEQLRDRFFAWLESTKNAIPRKWRAATSAAAEKEFKALIARCPAYQEGVE